MPRILAFAGSTRTESLNKKLVRVAAEAARSTGGDVTLVDLRDFPMPLYDGDLEEAEGLPEHAVSLKKLMKEHQGLILSCPEYNSSISGVLKNTIDWLSRRQEGEEPLAAFKDKIAALYSASPGRLGGLRGLVTVRSILANIGVWVLPQQVAVPRAHQIFDESGAIEDEDLAGRVRELAERLVDATGKLRG